MTTFFERLEMALGESSAGPRNVWEKLRPFQRKIALLEQAKALIEHTPFIPLEDKPTILYRTMTSKEVLSEKMAWKRARNLERGLQELAEAMKPFCDDDNDKNHQEIVHAYVQDQYWKAIGNQKSPAPKGWEHSHNHQILVYRMYYQGTIPDPHLPQWKPIRNVVVPVQRPTTTSETTTDPSMMTMTTTIATGTANDTTGTSVGDGTNTFTIAVGTSTTAAAGVTQRKRNNASRSDDEDDNDNDDKEQAKRQKLLHEVRMHMDLLQDFEGIIPAAELAARKRQLFQALPQAPPPQSLS